MNKTILKYAKTTINTIACAVFLIVGAISALSLRDELKLEGFFKYFLGSVLLAFVLYILLTTIFKAHKG